MSQSISYPTYVNINIFFSLRKDSRTRRHEVTIVKNQCRLDSRKYSFSQKKINGWNKLYTGCVTASSVNMFKDKVDTYLRRAGYTSMKTVWTLDKPMASLSTCHLSLCSGMVCWLGDAIVVTSLGSRLRICSTYTDATGSLVNYRRTSMMR